MKAILLTIGDEILLGQTLDTNSAWLGQHLNLLGIRVTKRITCGDDTPAILQAIREAERAADLLIMTGGLGPTKDDITKNVLAEYYHTDLVFHQPTFDRIERIFHRLGRRVTDLHREQSYFPSNAELLPNPMGTAPGMWFFREHLILISLPGVPYEMKAIMTETVLPRLQDHPLLEPIIHRTLLTAGLGESDLAERIKSVEEQLPDHISLAYLPSLGQVRLRLSAFGGERTAMQHAVDKEASAIAEILGNHIFGEENQRLEGVLGRLLTERGLRLATAESCTGGHIAHRITQVPGSSRYYLGSLVTYHNHLKVSKLGVRESDLIEQGAVSEPVVRSMLQGVLQELDADVGIAASGIAGPEGGSVEKPVGTIWIAVGDRHQAKTWKLQLGKDREKNIEATAILAINALRRWLLDHPDFKGPGINR